MGPKTTYFQDDLIYSKWTQPPLCPGYLDIQLDPTVAAPGSGKTDLYKPITPISDTVSLISDAADPRTDL